MSINSVHKLLYFYFLQSDWLPQWAAFYDILILVNVESKEWNRNAG